MIQKYVDLLLVDMRGTFAHIYRIVMIFLIVKIWSVINKVLGLLVGVHIGECTKFIGRTRFNRHVKSRISLGERCLLNSSSFYNLIGVNKPCMISTLTQEAKIIIGDDCEFSGVTIGSFNSIEIHSNVRCGANVIITDSDWHIDDPRVSCSRPVVIEKNAWLGMNSVILKGVKIGANAIIGANSVVTRDIPANAIAAGNPCKVIKINS